MEQKKMSTLFILSWDITLLQQQYKALSRVTYISKGKENSINISYKKK